MHIYKQPLKDLNKQTKKDNSAETQWKILHM